MKLKKRNLNSILVGILVVCPVFMVICLPFIIYCFPSEFTKFDYLNTIDAFVNLFSSSVVFLPFTNFIVDFFHISNIFLTRLIFCFEWTLAVYFCDFFFYILFTLLNFGKRLIDMFNSNL